MCRGMLLSSTSFVAKLTSRPSLPSMPLKGVSWSFFLVSKADVTPLVCQLQNNRLSPRCCYGVCWASIHFVKQIFFHFDLGTKSDTIRERASNADVCSASEEQPPISTTRDSANSCWGLEKCRLCTGSHILKCSCWTPGFVYLPTLNFSISSGQIMQMYIRAVRVYNCHCLYVVHN